MSYQVTATRDGKVVRVAYAANRETADRAYGNMLDRHPDCEVRLLEGEVVLASSGPRRGNER